MVKLVSALKWQNFYSCKIGKDGHGSTLVGMVKWQTGGCAAMVKLVNNGKPLGVGEKLQAR